MLIISRKQVSERIKQPNQEQIRTPEEKVTYKYFEILEADTAKQVEMKEKILKVYRKILRTLLKTELYC